MAQLSVGPSWHPVLRANGTRIIEAFKRMTIAGYAKNFAKFAGEQFLVEPLVKTRNSDKIVESKLLGSEPIERTVQLSYAPGRDKWKIVDIYLNGYVSQLALRRADFPRPSQAQAHRVSSKRSMTWSTRQMSGIADICRHRLQQGRTKNSVVISVQARESSVILPCLRFPDELDSQTCRNPTPVVAALRSLARPNSTAESRGLLCAMRSRNRC